MTNQQKKLIVFIALGVIIFVCFAAACFGIAIPDDTQSNSISGVHSAPEQINSDEPYGSPKLMHQYKQQNAADGFSLVLSETQSFTLIFPLSSSYMGYGAYTEENGYLTLTTRDDKQYKYVFFVRADGSLVFDLSRSKINIASPLPDRAIFK